ncbi:MAG: sigma-70 family RNA polymerase sigma factor [Acidimicrobiia bacterium]
MAAKRVEPKVTAKAVTSAVPASVVAAVARAAVSAAVPAAAPGAPTTAPVEGLMPASAPTSPAIEQHLPLVEQIVVQVAVNFPRHVDRGELVRAGVLGLVEAANRFDEAKGVPFDRFAARRIRGAILDAVRSADWAPRSVRALSRRADSVEQRLASELGRLPSVDELAGALGTTALDLANLRDRVFRSVVLALDYRLGDEEEDLSLVDVLCDRTATEPSEELEAREMRSYLRDAVKLLPERHRLVIVGYFLEGRTSEELARFLGVTESRVSQLRSEALIMLREGIEAQYVPEDVEEETPVGRVARRKATYASAIGNKSDWRRRLERESAADAAAASRIQLSV